jgi:hypothetical protein
LTTKKSTTVLRVGDHRSGGPMGVVDQSLLRIREPNSLVRSSECPCVPAGVAVLLSAVASEVSSLTCALLDLVVFTGRGLPDCSGGPGYTSTSAQCP